MHRRFSQKTNKWIQFVCLFRANKTNLFVIFWENLRRAQTAFGFIWPVIRSIIYVSCDLSQTLSSIHNQTAPAPQRHSILYWILGGSLFIHALKWIFNSSPCTLSQTQYDWRKIEQVTLQANWVLQYRQHLVAASAEVLEFWAMWLMFQTLKQDDFGPKSISERRWALH